VIAEVKSLHDELKDEVVGAARTVVALRHFETPEFEQALEHLEERLEFFDRHGHGAHA